MALLDTLEHYYGDRDNDGNYRCQETPEPTEDEFDALEDFDLDNEDNDSDFDDVIEDDDPSYGRREQDLEED